MIADHKRWFQSVVRGFLDKVGESTRQRAIQRRAAHWWIRCLHAMLIRMCGFGLDVFCSGETTEAVRALVGCTETEFLARGRILTVSLDQHSVGWASCFFLKRAPKLNIVGIGDFAHRVWNDCEVSLGRAGLWEVVLLSSVLFNINFGPYDGSKWWRTCQEAATEYFQKIGSPRCALFLSMVPSIAKERGEAHLVTEPNYAERLWEQMQSMECMQWKGPKMALCRWFSWHECYRFWRGCWSMRALIMLYWGLQMGYLTEEPGTSVLRLSGVLKPVGSEQSKGSSHAATMRQGMAAQKKIYQQSKNQLHVASLVAIDRDVREGSAIIHAGCRSLHGWYAEGLREVRSAPGSVRWHAKQAAGGCLVPLAQTFSLLQDLPALSDLGFTTEISSLPLSSYSATLDGQVLLQEERERLSIVVRLCFELVRARGKSCCVFLDQYPLHAAAILADEDADNEIARTLRDMQAVHHACDLPTSYRAGGRT